MIIDRRKLVSYRCPFCGSMRYEPFSIFDFQKKSKHVILCSCRKSALQAYSDGSRNYNFEIPCIICGSIHKVKFSSRSLWDNCINSIVCDKTNTEIAYVGEQAEVHEKVNRHEKEIDDLIDKLGFDDYFLNVRIMLDVLNRIHDLAETGGLMCECGSSKIGLSLYPDKIKLSCRKCHATMFVHAENNQDLISLCNCERLIIYKQVYETLRR